MELTRYFWLPEGRLRAGWRLLLFVAFFLVCFVVTGLIFVSLLFRFGPLVTQTAVLSTSALLATWAMMRWGESQSFLAVGLVLERESAKEMALGFGGGVVLVGAIALVEWSAGVIEMQPNDSSSGSFLVFTTVVIFVAASAEELLFRGYPFQRLVEGTGSVLAVIVFAGLFGLLHASNPHATRLSILNTMLAGVLLSLAYLKTRALWLPMAFHFSWNWTMTLAGFPVSGLEVFQMPWRIVPSSEHIWLHGGNYGPEGGLLASAALTVGVVFLLGRWGEV
ncbi:MAG: CPBP family intramembrane metalloprotease [Acidobacteria bacterium]|nr:CPBP family intramembrane metalloprotease [Acidobacteriota bacterium]